MDLQTFLQLLGAAGENRVGRKAKGKGNYLVPATVTY